MNIYVFDANVFMDLFGYYYESRFPTLWERFYHGVDIGQITSVREVKHEIDGHYKKDRRINQWARKNSKIFSIPSEEEMLFVQEIFKIEHFQAIISNKNRLEGKPVADPFIIAKAKIINGTVVTNEANRPNGVKIPNICEYFKVKCIDLEKFMEVENWSF
ncbi:MAG: hypothetical protein A4E52_01890 [Pelotomaculum sp. PtaB.Bin013]|uniref:DUF4411 family protein n=1 Tax=Pelotomaculum isophthalicicum JI TaxID=947010 RepID=A0A9X4H6B3_9FIRM|nr:PIN domain-containing protein [Pelotomaculum isophthalicicum]MDF9409122.1 DUF4411 family protein [Pelotomaculum isophthalicicum JI]OPX83205.1 MAG: hypothetical protein A4E52_01890 [Pelotomaculum sp. PtaB.Bin013]